MSSHEIITRKEAVERGLKRYFIGVPCPKGHICERLTSSRNCYECALDITGKRRKDRKDFLSTIEKTINNPLSKTKNPKKPISMINFQHSFCTYSFWGIWPEFITDSTIAVSMHKDGAEYSQLYEITIDGNMVRQLTFPFQHTSVSEKSNSFLNSFTSSPNPFTSETKLNFTLNRMTYVTIEVYDLLGNKVFGNAGRSYEAGSYEINLDGSTIPTGTFYARISTGFGEVKTVKLVHEK